MMGLRQWGGKHKHLSMLLAMMLMLGLFVSIAPVVGVTCRDTCGSSHVITTQSTQYKTVTICSNVKVCVPTTTCKPVSTCKIIKGKRVCTTQTVCTTKSACKTQRICSSVRLKSECTTKTTVKDCTNMVKCGNTGCAAAGTYQMISQRTTCGSWVVG